MCHLGKAFSFSGMHILLGTERSLYPVLKPLKKFLVMISPDF
jgi:hypothetical protein